MTKGSICSRIGPTLHTGLHTASTDSLSDSLERHGGEWTMTSVGGAARGLHMSVWAAVCLLGGGIQRRVRLRGERGEGETEEEGEF